MPKYRKKPIVINAIQWSGGLPELESLGSYQGAVSQALGSRDLQIETLEGVMTANIGDWIIRGVKGELYPCKHEIFLATYEEVVAT